MSDPQTNKPDFFIVGAPKCGTTSLHDYLDQHPDIFMSPVKEPCYFGRDTGVIPGVRDETTYRKLFRGAGERICGEASTVYLASKTAAREIHAWNPDARIIIMLRDPVGFLQSYHNQQVYEGNEDITEFGDALAAEPDRRAGRRLPRRVQRVEALYYREAARFTAQVRRYFDIFPRETIHVVLYDEYAADTLAEVRKVYAFLGVDATFEPRIEVHHARPVARLGWLHRVLVNPRLRHWGKRMLPDIFATRLGVMLVRWNTRAGERADVPENLRRELLEEYRDEYRELGDLIGRDLSHWFE